MTVDLSPGQSKCSRQQHDGDAMPGGPAPPSFLIRDILSEPAAHGAAAAAAAAAAASLAAQGLMHVPFAQHHPLHPLAHHHLPRPPSPADSYSRHSDRDDGHGRSYKPRAGDGGAFMPSRLFAWPQESAPQIAPLGASFSRFVSLDTSSRCRKKKEKRRLRGDTKDRSPLKTQNVDLAAIVRLRKQAEKARKRGGTRGEKNLGKEEKPSASFSGKQGLDEGGLSRTEKLGPQRSPVAVACSAPPGAGMYCRRSAGHVNMPEALGTRSLRGHCGKKRETAIGSHCISPGLHAYSHCSLNDPSRCVSVSAVFPYLQDAVKECARVWICAAVCLSGRPATPSVGAVYVVDGKRFSTIPERPCGLLVSSAPTCPRRFSSLERKAEDAESIKT
ncbi:hypothetical protein HPB48_016432 [Haemaphysalis longicornis]|uniref:Uncharacterized protein n=1 Tax=Haemaphysalis longicornis TaxID=44386 RepID=A0A9J6FBY5_HAELO|nr:hypothetical protein HPB48_016432 [Haemaphysalis longicornis]